MKKLTIISVLILLGLSLSVSAGRYNDRQVINRDARSAAKGIHDQNRRNQQRPSKKSNHIHNNVKRRSNQPGYNHDYRDNRHFDDSYVVTKPRYSRSYDRKHRRSYSYGDWRHDSQRYRKQWRHNGHTYFHYEPYRYDRYRYRPVRGLGHYFDRAGYGYGHWHEGRWCGVYHEPSFYVSYYNHYPYHNGWRVGDGDFGIWFRF